MSLTTTVILNLRIVGCVEVEAFKEEFGHCEIPASYPDNASLEHHTINSKKD